MIRACIPLVFIFYFTFQVLTERVKHFVPPYQLRTHSGVDIDGAPFMDRHE